MSSTKDSVKIALSANRISTYEQAKGVTKAGLVLPLSLDKALELYAWNAQVSAAFLHPLHICEVVVRNGVANTIEAVYGPNWPWSAAFIRSLPNPASGYSMRRDLISGRNGETTVGKVIPELKFAFWQRMFTGRNDLRLWTPLLRQCFPHFPTSMDTAACRTWMFNALDSVRALRNRIAHHEPIFARNLIDDFDVVSALITRRCPDTAVWMKEHQQVSALLAKPPI